MGFASGGSGGGGSDGEIIVAGPWSKSGVLSTGTGTIHWINNTGYTLTFVEATAHVDTAPTGADIIVDINKEGSTIFDATKVVIAATENDGSSTDFLVATIADGETITADIDQVGSTVAGEDLTIELLCSF